MREPVRFLADENVAKLGRWLRVLGYDVAYESPTTDARLALRARRENRVLLTRDNDFLERGVAIRCFMPRSTQPLEQVREVLEAFELKPSVDRIFCRCVECNAPVEPIAKDLVRACVPPYVFRVHQRFHRCPACGKVYWRGTHIERVLELFERSGIRLMSDPVPSASR